MMSDRTSQHVSLADGRTLGYAEYGDPEGRPTLYFHGFPMSRLDWPLNDPHDVAAELGVRVLAVDRPGAGLSSFKPGFRILEWPEDVTAFANALGLDQFAVIGVSGGAPYAAACALSIPERITATTICAGMGPPDAPGAADGFSMVLPRKGPLMRRLLFWLSDIGARKDPARVLLSLDYPPMDAELLARPEVLDVAAKAMLEATRDGVNGAAWLAGLYAQPWGFRLEDVQAPVALLHGEADRNVPISVARHVANRLPNCAATFLPTEGHLTLTPNNIRRVLTTGC